jgi:hypothetical protein
MRSSSFLVAALLALFPACASTKESVPVDPNGAEDAKAGFERIKSLAGDWAGMGGEHSGMSMVEVRYRVTAAGSAVEETLMPGTNDEMVTMYHLDNDKLMLTHYCSAGNQPTMVGVPVRSKDGQVASIRFDFAHATNMASPNAGHMHAAEMVFESKNNLASKWTYWENGKPGHESTFQLTRKSTTAMTYFRGTF